MNYTKSLFLLPALLMSMSLAIAGNDKPSNSNGPTTINSTGGQGGHGGQGGQGGSAAAIAGASAQAGVASNISNSVRNDVSSTNLNANTNSVRNDNTNAQQQGQQQGQGQQQAAISNSGGNKLTNEGNNSKQSTSTNVNIGGDVTESNTPPVVAGVLPSVPTSCRLYLFGGGSTRDGAASGTLPIGNDQTCLSIATLNLMERAGGFTQAEKQVVVCKVEGMEGLETCKAATSKKTAAAPAAAPVASDARKPWMTDPLARKRDGLAPL